MQGTIGPDVARAAVALRRSHPAVPPLEVLTVCMRHRTGSLADFGDEIKPATPFGDIVAEVFDSHMAPNNWKLVTHPNTAPALVAALLKIWHDEVLPKFAGHFGLKP